MAGHLGTTAHLTAVGEDLEEEIKEAIVRYKEFRKRKKVVSKASAEKMESFKIEFTAFLIKHTLPFSLTTELLDFMKLSLEKYGKEVIETVEVSRETAKTIAVNCISKSFKDSIYKDLATKSFSLSFDGSSDKYGPSYLCTHVRYVKDGELVSQSRTRFIRQRSPGYCYEPSIS